MSPATAGCVPLVSQKPAASPASDNDDSDSDSSDDDDPVGVYGDHVDDETGLYMGPDYESTGSSSDDTTDYSESSPFEDPSTDP